MARKQKQQVPKRKITKNSVIIIGAAVAAISLIAYFGINSTIPVNGTAPVFGAPRNTFIKASYSQSDGGYVYTSQASGAVKGVRTSGNVIVNPTYSFTKGSIETIRFTNDAYGTDSMHNFNIDAFNVHTKNLGYYGSQSITFIADKAGTFQYYCTLHPEMKGTIEVKDTSS